jgi:hypothetical protein
MYFHLDKEPTEAMKDGKLIHEGIADYVKEHKKFPEWFFNYELKNPEPEREVVVSYNELFDLKCIIDLLDGPLLFEYKTGITDSLAWSRTDQIPLYFLACEIADIDVDTAFLIRHNQYSKKSDFTVVHNSKRLREHARNVIDSIAPEIHSFFLEAGLI